VPANTFVFSAQAPQVVTVTADNRIHWQKISVRRDLGTQSRSSTAWKKIQKWL
jgi:hypothetical protein